MTEPIRQGDITGFDDADILILEDEEDHNPIEKGSVVKDTKADND